MQFESNLAVDRFYFCDTDLWRGGVTVHYFSERGCFSYYTCNVINLKVSVYCDIMREEITLKLFHVIYIIW